MTSDIPVPTEADYLDAARAFSETARLTGGFLVPTVEESAALYAANRKFRAAVDSAHAAGWRARIPGEVEMEHIRYDRRWCPWHEMLDSDGDDCGDTRPDQEVYPVRVVTLVVRAPEVPSGLSRESNPASTERGTT